MAQAGVGLGKRLLQALCVQFHITRDDACQGGDDVIARNAIEFSQAAFLTSAIANGVSIDVLGGGDFGRHQIERLLLDRIGVGEVVHLDWFCLPNAPTAAAGLQDGVNGIMGRHPNDGGEVEVE